jgi:hypothetical protein
MTPPLPAMRRAGGRLLQGVRDPEAPPRIAGHSAEGADSWHLTGSGIVNSHWQKKVCRRT